MSNNALLDLQGLDVEAGQLEHRRKSLPQRTALSEALAEQAHQQEAIDAIAAQRATSADRQRQLESEAAALAAKADSDEARLYSGEVTGLKDLEVLQHEIAGLRSRQSEIEDGVLEAMENREVLDEQIRDLESRRATIDESISRLQSEIEAEESVIAGQLAQLAEKRADLASGIDPVLVDEYEKRRPEFGAATVVRFSGSNCVGCPSTMPAIEVDRIKRLDDDSPVDCQECGRIVLH